MADQTKLATGASKNNTDVGQSSGIQKDPGPYIGTVIEHVKGTRMGQLKVSIPQFQGTATTNTDYQTVSYASPFYGKTFGTDTQNLGNDEIQSGQSYGMWMVPPDIGSKVLCIFVDGDRDQGYWFACVYDGPSHHMVPGNGRAVGGLDKTKIPNYLNSDVYSTSNIPVTEYSTKEATAFDPDGLTNTPRYAHPYQTKVLMNQGLDRDFARGAISSSSMREVPSNVYGISTPGRRPGGAQSANPDITVFRKGGHSFVMDDGDADGKDQLIRLRTTNGHQVLLNDSENLLYISSASGAHWIEFSNNGQMNIYAYGGFNVRTQGVMNFHSDSLINFQAPAIKMNASGGDKGNALQFSSDGNFVVSALMGATVKTDGMLSLTSEAATYIAGGGMLSLGSLGVTRVNGSILMLNSGVGGVCMPAVPMKKGSHPDVGQSGATWVIKEDALESICTVVPAHEPWVQADGKSRPKPVAPPQGGFFG